MLFHSVRQEPRRKFLLGTGAAATGGSALLGTGAFTSVEAARSVSVDVVGDADAYLRLAPCTDDDGNEKPNGDYVYGHSNGTISIDLSSSNPETENELGDGVNPEALTRIDNILEICNQGTQDICVDFAVDVPEIQGEVPDRYDFEEGDPAAVFYRGSNRNEIVNVDELDTDRSGAISLHVENGTCECIGMEIRAFGFETGTDLFAETDLTIRAEAGADCVEGVPDNGCVDCGPDGDAERLTKVTFRNEGEEKELSIGPRPTGQQEFDAIFDEDVGSEEKFTIDIEERDNPQYQFKVGRESVEVRHSDDDDNDYFSVSCSKTVHTGMRLHTDDEEVMHEISVVSAEDKSGDEIC